MTDREKAIVMAHTGICMLEGERLGVFYQYLNELYGRPVYTHEWLTLDIKEKSKPDFLKLCKGEESSAEHFDERIDSISRQAVIDTLSFDKEMLSRVLDDMDVVGTDREKYSWGLGLIESNIKDIEELPSAERHGRWKETTTLNLWECSICGHIIYSETVLDRKTFHKRCGRCEAKMDEVE